MWAIGFIDGLKRIDRGMAIRVDRHACWKWSVIALRHHDLTKRSRAGRHIQNERCLA
jgi:hypothetical protein